MSGHIVYGQALYESNRFDGAQAVFETALSLDPENLIALKHLGDIARQAGDLKAARIWYQRVLEADPRNEEIAQLMISLLAVPEPAPQSPPTPVVQAPPVGREPLSREPLRPTPSVSATPSLPSEPVTGEETALVVEKSEAEPLRAGTPAAPVPSPIVREGVVPPRISEATKALDGQDFLSLDDFNIGANASAERGESRVVDPDADAAAPAADAVPVAPFEMESDELQVESTEPDVTLESGFDLGTEDQPFEADPFAIAAVPVSESPATELATDLRLGLPDDESAEPMDEHRTAESLDGLQTFEPGVIDTLSTPSEPLERDEFFGPVPGAAVPEAQPEALREPQPEQQPEQQPELEPEAVAAPRTFVTETMAELYLRQGHLDSALDIYRQLVERRPDDVSLQGRLREVETKMRDEAAAAATATAQPAAPVYGGPTIREFLAGLAARRTPIFGVSIEPAIEYAEQSAQSDTDYGDTRGHTRDVVSARADVESPTTVASGGSVSGSIDALFGGADASPSDAAAASTLQEAFANDGPDTAPLRGVPAHTASSELSLDHVFKGNAPPPPDNDGFSFDQFFADEMTDAAPNATGENAIASQPADDIAQFNAWLNGLKKT
jgi:tetratricopeptide (TPR) repeat protein